MSSRDYSHVRRSSIVVKESPMMMILHTTLHNNQHHHYHRQYDSDTSNSYSHSHQRRRKYGGGKEEVVIARKHRPRSALHDGRISCLSSSEATSEHKHLQQRLSSKSLAYSLNDMQWGLPYSMSSKETNNESSRQYLAYSLNNMGGGKDVVMHHHTSLDNTIDSGAVAFSPVEF